MALTITVENCKEYFNEQIAPNLPFKVQKISSIEEVTEQTNVNWIYRADMETDQGNKTVYLRQSRHYVKKKPDIQLDPARIAFEVKVLKFLNKFQHGINPEVLYFDKENNVCALSDIKRNGELLVNELVSGNPHPETGKKFGEIIANFHGKTLGIKIEELGRSENENADWAAFHIGMRTEPALKDFSKETKEFLEISKKAKTCLVLGDLASKNIFIDDKDIRFLDLERAFIGNPAFDVAFFSVITLLKFHLKKLSILCNSSTSS